MRVRIYAINTTGVGMYRGILPAKSAESDCVIDRGVPAALDREDRVVSVDPIPADVVVLQRACTRLLVEAIPLIQQQGIAVVVDVDDDISTINPRHPPESIRLFRQQDKYLRQACRLADLVTVSTPAIRDRYRRDAVILRNCIQERLLRLEPRPEVRTIGWTGIGSEHLDDFETVGSALEVRGTRFLVVGTAPGDSYRKPDEITGLLRFDDYQDQMCRIAVGIAPLHSKLGFNRAKSWLKPLEYAAHGIPFVRSRTPEYDRLGLGLYAERPRHWRRCLHLLINNDAARYEMGQQVRGFAAEHTFELNAWKWDEAWSEALLRRKWAKAPPPLVA